MTHVSEAPQLPATLDQQITWAKVYNIYADTLLGTSLIPSEVCVISSDCFSEDGYLHASKRCVTRKPISTKCNLVCLQLMSLLRCSHVTLDFSGHLEFNRERNNHSDRHRLVSHFCFQPSDAIYGL